MKNGDSCILGGTSFTSGRCFNGICKKACSSGVCCDTTNGIVYDSDHICRAEKSNCDVPEYCTGNSVNCPVDQFKSSSFVCREKKTGSLCDVEEKCTGSSPDCPADAFQPKTNVCREKKPGSLCDVEEKCTGSSPDCPADAFQPNTNVCREKKPGSLCDVEEKCTGSSPDCPADAFQPNTNVCRNKKTGSLCDVEEKCTGSSPDCPADAFQPNTMVCREPVTGQFCPNYCTGTSADCPNTNDPNLIQNPDFDYPALIGGSFQKLNYDFIPNWPRDANYGCVWLKLQNGNTGKTSNQWVELDTNCNGAIFQFVTGLTAGKKYHYGLYYSPHPNNPKSSEGFLARWGGSALLWDYRAGGATTSWQFYSATVTSFGNDYVVISAQGTPDEVGCMIDSVYVCEFT